MREIHRTRFGSIIHEHGYFVVLWNRNREHREFRTLHEAEDFLHYICDRYEKERYESAYVKSPEQIKQENRSNALDKLLG
jgi:hypothetical protein